VYISCTGIGQEKDVGGGIKCEFGDYSFHLTLDLDQAMPRRQQLKV
jgi:hypothetical protein